MKAMILAAGLGTRLKPFTDHHPKALMPVNGITLLERNIRYLQSYGIQEIVINVHHFASQIIDFVNTLSMDIPIHISSEIDEVLETGGGVLKAAPWLQDANNFVVMNADILTNMILSDMINTHIKNDALVTLAVSKRESSRCFLFNKEDVLCGWKNKNTEEVKIKRQAETLIEKSFSGIQIISNRIFNLPHRTGKFSLVDWYLDLASDNTLLAYDHTGTQVLDVGKPESIAMAEKIFM